MWSRAVPFLAALATLGSLATGCGDGLAGWLPLTVSAVTYNLAGERLVDEVMGPAILEELVENRPDFALVQETWGGALATRVPRDYRLVDDPTFAETAILYLAETWSEVESGVIALGNDDGWGMREARWARLQRVGSDAEVYVYNTHLCVPIRSDADRCDTARQRAHVQRIIDDIGRRNGPTIFGGDLNVFDGFADGPVVSYIEESGLVDTYRALDRRAADTFEGTTWAPPGRIDYLFASRPLLVLEADIAPTSSSDHRPVRATVRFE